MSAEAGSTSLRRRSGLDQEKQTLPPHAEHRQHEGPSQKTALPRWRNRGKEKSSIALVCTWVVDHQISEYPDQIHAASTDTLQALPCTSSLHSSSSISSSHTLVITPPSSSRSPTTILGRAHTLLAGTISFSSSTGSLYSLVQDAQPWTMS